MGTPSDGKEYAKDRLCEKCKDILLDYEVTVCEDCTEENIRQIHMTKYFEWITECAVLLGVDGKHLVEDVNWFMCFDDKMSPEEAVAEFKTKGEPA